MVGNGPLCTIRLLNYNSVFNSFSGKGLILLILQNHRSPLRIQMIVNSGFNVTAEANS